MLDVVMWSLCTVPFGVAGNLLHVRMITGRQFGLLGREHLDDPASRAVPVDSFSPVFWPTAHDLAHSRASAAGASR
ncbi:hypothetical protein AWB67_07048 [Caballeronia terrestris]|uniref:Uncharacterized protein n=1 Tax=Caballeronia terrestris TaxID=1226301 RepID=A0A158KXI1_9BURK|nr:hypothetical protein [Caballeronia terrestris]SAL85842.1 hypothetical protein AWB67_07048 [Caballeronia terrestris]